MKPEIKENKVVLENQWKVRDWLEYLEELDPEAYCFLVVTDSGVSNRVMPQLKIDQGDPRQVYVNKDTGISRVYIYVIQTYIYPEFKDLMGDDI